MGDNRCICWCCRSGELVWNNDFSYEDYGLEGEGIVSVLSCSNEECGAVAEFYREV